MARLRTVTSTMPGWQRRRQGRGFTYRDVDGVRLCDSDTQRCRDLVIPPAWTDVWICPLPNGHLQAIGTDDAGRQQYLYHPDWRTKRDRAKFEHMLDFAARLPAARRRAASDLRSDRLTYERAAATAFRLFDLGVFRLGSERYAEDNGSYGLATLQKRHVRRTGVGVEFDYVAKSGQPRSLVVADTAVCEAIDLMRARRSAPDSSLLAHQGDGRWHELTSESVSSYLKDVVGDDASAKDFRTWHANVAAAAILALQDAASKTARKKAVTEAMRFVADYLGNTPAVTRSSYVDPRLIDLFERGTVIDEQIARSALPEAGVALRPRLEKAVLALLS